MEWSAGQRKGRDDQARPSMEPAASNVVCCGSTRCVLCRGVGDVVRRSRLCGGVLVPGDPAVSDEP